VLSEFRTRLVALTAEERLLEAVIALCKQHGWLKEQGQQRTDSTHVLARIRALSRAECVVETLRHALNILSVVTPDWLQNQVQPDWLERYGPRASEFRFPAEEDKRQQFLHQVGQDGWGLLSAITTDPDSQWMLSIPAVDTLHRVWKQDYLPQEKGGTWIADQDRLEAAKLCFSPYALDASAAKKRSTYWIGYKVHFTETCDEDRPRLITHVLTNIGPIPDRDELPEIQAALKQQELLPQQHLVDAGYVDAEALLASQTAYHVDLVGPTAQDHRGPGARAEWLCFNRFFPRLGARASPLSTRANQ
jgi:transposase